MIGERRSKPIIMLILSDKTKSLHRVMDKVERDVEERRRKEYQDAKLSRELRRMSRESDSIQRTGDKRKIRSFNKKYVSHLKDLSLNRQARGNTNRDEVVKQVKEWKENL